MQQAKCCMKALHQSNFPSEAERNLHRFSSLTEHCFGNYRIELLLQIRVIYSALWKQTTQLPFAYNMVTNSRYCSRFPHVRKNLRYNTVFFYCQMLRLTYMWLFSLLLPSLEKLLRTSKQLLVPAYYNNAKIVRMILVHTRLM